MVMTPYVSTGSMWSTYKTCEILYCLFCAEYTFHKYKKVHKKVQDNTHTFFLAKLLKIKMQRIWKSASKYHNR